MTESKFRCVIHGSFRKHFDLIQGVHRLFTASGIEVLAPKAAEIIAYHDGFGLLTGEKNQDPRLIELLYLDNLRKLGANGFSYFVNPDGYIGTSASYELGIAHATNVGCFFYDKLADHPAFVKQNMLWRPHELASYIKTYDQLPQPTTLPNEQKIQKLWEDLLVPGSVVAAGAIIEHEGKSGQKETLLVKTHKWGNRYSIVGGKVRRNELLDEAMLREVKEETNLKGTIGKHLATFDQLKNSGYYKDYIQHIFVDKIVKVSSKFVRLNEEAQEYLWVPVSIALKELDIEPNARHTLELYAQTVA